MNNVRTTLLDHAGGGWLTAIRFVIASILLLGLAFPMASALLGRVLFSSQANGSLIERDGRVVGSSLVAQPFADARYFQPRPSAANFDPKALAGSNMAPNNPDLRARVAAGSAVVAQREGVTASAIPIDLVTASGSGMDPHISPASARLQIARVAAARGLAPERVQALVQAHTEDPTFGLLGQARVNVLQLNLALDALTP